MATSSEKSHKPDAPAKLGAAGAIVLGSGRSGTSAIVRSFVAAGFFAGRDEDLYGPDPGNPLGHYEALSILEINDELLKRFGCTWWADAPPPDEQLSKCAGDRPRMKAALAALIEAAEGAPVVIKEPRINGLLPLWGPLIDGILHPVLAVRDPLEIALSQAHRDGTSIVHALASWETLTTMALQWLDGRTATVAHFAALTADHEVAAKLVGDTARHLSSDQARHVRPADAASALRADLHRQRSAELDHTEYLTSHQIALWEYLRDLPIGEFRFEVPPRLDRSTPAARATMKTESRRMRMHEEHVKMAGELSAWEERVAQLERSFATATALAQQAVVAAEARAEATAHEAAAAADRHADEIAAIKASPSWRLTAPLRRLKRLLRPHTA